jgi:hypothetical protein
MPSDRIRVPTHSCHTDSRSHEQEGLVVHAFAACSTIGWHFARKKKDNFNAISYVPDAECDYGCLEATCGPAV